MKTRKVDAVNYITTLDDVVAYLNVALEENDPGSLTQALGTVARSKGLTKIAEMAGLKREDLHESLEDGNPSFSTVCNVLAACGLKQLQE